MPFWMMMASCRDLLAHRSGQAKQRLRPAQVGADVRDGWWSWLGQVRLQPLFQDGLDGAVVRVAIGQRPLAGGVQAHLTVLLRQADNALAFTYAVNYRRYQRFAAIPCNAPVPSIERPVIRGVRLRPYVGRAPRLLQKE